MPNVSYTITWNLVASGYMLHEHGEAHFVPVEELKLTAEDSVAWRQGDPNDPRWLRLVLAVFLRRGDTDTSPLVAFFRDETPEWGIEGDALALYPEQTAILLLRRARDAMAFYARHAITEDENRYLRLYRSLGPEQQRAVDAFGRHLLAEATHA